MTTTSGLREITDADVDQALERVLLPRLSELLSARGNGHCMRINDVDGQLSATLTRRLRGVLSGCAMRRPTCMSWTMMRPPAACTASMTSCQPAMCGSG